MAHRIAPDLFATETQPDLFGAEAANPSYRPDPDKVRSRLHKILGEARAAQTFPWEPTRVSLYRTIFPRCRFGCPDEGAQLRFQFETELDCVSNSRRSWRAWRRPDTRSLKEIIGTWRSRWLKCWPTVSLPSGSRKKARRDLLRYLD